MRLKLLKKRKEKENLAKEHAVKSLEKLKEQEKSIEKLPNGILLFISKPDNYGQEAIKIYIENKIKTDLNSTFIITDINEENKLTFYVGITKDLIQKGFKAKDIVNKIAEVTGGRGGGRDDFAQAGGKDISRVSEALELGKNFISKPEM